MGVSPCRLSVKPKRLLRLGLWRLEARVGATVCKESKAYVIGRSGSCHMLVWKRKRSKNSAPLEGDMVSRPGMGAPFYTTVTEAEEHE
jgi:hypothetical protein